MRRWGDQSRAGIFDLCGLTWRIREKIIEIKNFQKGQALMESHVRDSGDQQYG